MCVCVCVCDGILFNHKKEWHNAICSNMDKPRDYHTKWGKSDKDKYHMILLICGIWKKSYKWIYLQNRNRPTDIENKCMVTKYNQGRDKLGVWDEQIHTAIYKIDKQQGLTG